MSLGRARKTARAGDPRTAKAAITYFGFCCKGATFKHAALASDAICLNKGPTCKTSFGRPRWRTRRVESEEDLHFSAIQCREALGVNFTAMTTLDSLAHVIDNDWRKTSKVFWKLLAVEFLTQKQSVSAAFQRALRILKDRLPEATCEAVYRLVSYVKVP